MDLRRKRLYASICMISSLVIVPVGAPLIFAGSPLVGTIVSAIGVLLWCCYLSLNGWCDGYEHGRLDEQIRQVELAIQVQRNQE